MHTHKISVFRIVSLCFLFGILMHSLSFSGGSVAYSSSSNYGSGVYYDRLNSTVLTGDPRVDLVNIALSQYGYSESDNGWDLDGMEFGINNYTEYGHWYGVQSLWCAMFVSWCANSADISDDIIPPHAYTASGLLWYMDRGRSYGRKTVENGGYTPQAGDLIYFRSDRNNSIVNHVGIVLGYFDGYVYTIEGNVNQDPNCTDGGQVLVRSRHISDPFIRYFCRPNYSSDTTHVIGSFYPEDYQSPEIADAEVTLGEQADDLVEIPDSGYISDDTQYNFFP